MTQQELAAAAGVTVATVNYAENRLSYPRISTIRKICKALGVQPKDVDEFRRSLDLPS